MSQIRQGYKQTKVGVIPLDWDVAKINEITNYVDYRGKTPTKTSSGIFLVTAKNIKKGYIDYDSSKEYVNVNDYSNVMSRGLPKINDVLLTTEAPLGNVAQINNVNIALAQRVIKFRAQKNLNNTYLKYHFLSDIFQSYLYRMAIGTTVLGIQGKILHKMRIPLPPLKEQEKIAEILTTWDSAISKQEELIKVRQENKKGLMQKLLSGEVRFDGFDEEWDIVRLEEVGKVISGLTYSPKNVNKNGVLVLRSSNIQNRQLSFTDNVYVNVDTLKYNPVVENDILICVRNGSKLLIGKNALVNKESEGVAFGAFMSIFRSKYNPFIFQLFDTEIYKREIHRNLGATINSINGSNLKKFKIPFPPLKEQQKIAQVLTLADKKIELLKTELKELKEQKKALMQKLLTGEVRVTI